MVCCSTTFFWHPGEICHRRDLGQHAGDDLIRQSLKGLMNTSFQIGKLRRMFPQLDDPLLLLILQLLLQIPQHLVNVFYNGARLTVDTDFIRHLPSMASTLPADYADLFYARTLRMTALWE